MDDFVEIEESSKGTFTLLIPAHCDDIYKSNEFKWFVNAMINKYPNYHQKMVAMTREYMAKHIHRFNINNEDDEEL
jgi:hypothetical protein